MLASALLAGVAQASAATLDQSLERIVNARGGPPGVSVLIQHGKQQRYLSAGVADVRTGRRPARSDHMRIASVSKGFSGVIALGLVDSGLLLLDSSIDARLPGVLPLAGPVTLRQALQHTGGLPDYIRTKTFLAQLTSDPGAYLRPRQLIDFVRDEPLEFRPGSRYRYSDTDNIVVGLMAEALTHRSYDRLLRESIFGPLGMRRTSLPRTVRMPRPYLHGYEVTPGKQPDDVSEVINPAGAWASGGIVSTPADLARFVPTYVTKVLSSTRGLPRRFRPGSSSPPGPGRNAAGLGIFRYRTRCGTVYGHTGSFPGYRLFVAGSADGSRSLVFTVNAQIVPGQGSQRVSDQIRRAQTQAVCELLR